MNRAGTSLMGISLTIALLAGACEIGDPGDDDAVLGEAYAAADAPPYFNATSYWRADVTSWPVDPDSAHLVTYLDNASTGTKTQPFLKLAGLSGSAWGMPIYHGKSTDPVYTVVCTSFCKRAPKSVRFPVGGRPSQDSDAEMSVTNLAVDGVSVDALYAFWNVVVDDGKRTITVRGGDTYYNSSGGISGSWNCCGSVAGNGGHRGVPIAAVGAVTWVELAAGHIDHALKIAVDETANLHCFPLDGDEGGGDGGVLPEGTHVAIRPDVDIDAVVSNPAARVIAHALQDYGAVVGDRGSYPALKLENLAVEGSLRPAGAPSSWSGVLPSDALKGVPFTLWEVKKLGYEPGSGTAKPCAP